MKKKSLCSLDKSKFLTNTFYWFYSYIWQTSRDQELKTDKREFFNYLYDLNDL